MYEMYGDPSPRNRPCVGSCYYEKLQGLKSKTKAEQIPNETVQVNKVEFSTVHSRKFKFSEFLLDDNNATFLSS